MYFVYDNNNYYYYYDNETYCKLYCGVWLLKLYLCTVVCLF